MSWQSWLIEQSPKIKLSIGLGFGILVYAIFRLFVAYANKSYKESIKNKKSKRLPIWEQG